MTAAAHRTAAPDVARADQTPASAPRSFANDRALLNALPIAAALVGITPGGLLKLIDFNPRFAAVIAANGDAKMVGGDFRDCVHADIAELMSGFLADPTAPSELAFCVGEGVSARHFKILLAPLERCPEFGPRCLVSLVDRTMEAQSERSLRAEMLRDSLTGLPNRVSFAESIEAMLEAPGEAVGHAVLVVDMLRFSRINESMGSLAGDELLMTFARRLISALRAGDVLARTGGNEFGVLVRTGRGATDALAAADRIQQVLTAPFRLGELEIQVECAIGVALMNRANDPEELFRSAQFAVKQAKQAGRPQVYAPREASLARRRFSIETELRRALDKDQLKLSYQPLVSLRTGEVAGFEALARWTHDDRGEISPTEFIPVAEESGLILQLGRWAMDRAMATLAAWDREIGVPLPCYVAVNMSAIQVARDNVAEMVETALRSNGIAGNRLTLELTESTIVQDPDRAIRVFEALKALDTTVAMDDFGTGYSSLAFLQRLPIDVLKIDRSFVSGMLRDSDSVAIVRAVLSLAEALGMSTTAEGIESVELATTLAALGCASGQGFYFAKPLEADAALDYWRSRRKV